MIDTGIILALISILGVLLKLNSRKDYMSNLKQHTELSETMKRNFDAITKLLDIVVIDTENNTKEIKVLSKELNTLRKEKSFKGDINDAFSEALIMTPDAKLINILNVLKNKTLEAVENRMMAGFTDIKSMEMTVLIDSLTIEMSNLIELSYGKKTVEHIMNNMSEYLNEYKRNIVIIFNDKVVNNIIGRYRSEVLNLVHKLIAEISRGTQQGLN